jgi:hypothetical protein
MRSRPLVLLVAAASCAAALSGCSASAPTSQARTAPAVAVRPVGNSSSGGTELPPVACQQAAVIAKEDTKELQEGVTGGGYSFGSGAGMMLPYAGNTILASSANLPEPAAELGRTLASVQDGFADAQQSQKILNGLEWMAQNCSS